MDTIIINAAGGVHVCYCDRCGQSLSHPISYQGQNYGPDCFEVVTGIREADVIYSAGTRAVDEAAMQARAAKRQQQADERAAEAAAFELRKAAVTAEQQWLLDVLRSLPYQEGFVGGMLTELTFNRVAELSWRVQDTLQDIYAKQTGGRRGSKKYDAACEEFDRLAKIVRPE